MKPEYQGFGGAQGRCEVGERCSCPPGDERRQQGRCAYWQAGEQKPIKVYGLLIMHNEQRPLIDKHCFGDCGKISMAGGIADDQVGALMVCCEEVCPWLKKQMDEPYGTTMSFGKPHEVYLRTITDTPGPAPTAGVAVTSPGADQQGSNTGSDVR
jgi:hypothetical protein